MEVVNHNHAYNPIQINYNCKKDESGNVTEKSVLVNIRTETVEQAFLAYQDLKQRLNGELSEENHHEQEVIAPFPEMLGERQCPKCHNGRLVVRKGKSGQFTGCSAYPGCRYTEPIV